MKKTDDLKNKKTTKNKNKKGFTLIELLAVIVILGILMLVAIPSVTRFINQSRQKHSRTQFKCLWIQLEKMRFLMKLVTVMN